jgi:arginase family enzyme
MPIRTGPQLRTAGILTFLRARRGTVDGLEAGMVAVVGVPYETSTPWKRGPLLGPRAYRETSLYYWSHADAAGDAQIEIDSGQRVDPAMVHRALRDLGDVPVSHVDWGQTEGLLRETSRRIVERGAYPVFLGGDHFVTYPLALGYADAVRERAGGRIGYIQLSSRLDLADEDPVYGRVWRGATVRRLLDTGAVRPENVAWIGATGYVRLEEWDAVQKLDGRVFTSEDVRRRGIRAVTTEAVAIASNGCDGIYVSVDVDAVDGGYVAMTGVPQLDGLRNVDVWEAMDVLGRAPVGALDLCGLNPLIEVMSLGKTGQRFGVHLILRFVYQKLFPTDGRSMRPRAAARE